MEQAKQAAGSDSVRGDEDGLAPWERELVELTTRTVAAELAGRLTALRTVLTKQERAEFAKAHLGLPATDGFLPLSNQPATAPAPAEIAEQIAQNAVKLSDPRFLDIGVRLVDFVKSACKHFACWRCIDPSMGYADGDSSWSWKQEAEDLKAKLDAIPVELDSPIPTDRDGGEAIAVVGQGTGRVIYRASQNGITSETPTQSQRPLGNLIDTKA